MFYRMIEKKRDMWYSSPECTVKNIVEYIVSTNQMRDAQIDAIKTYLFLKIACGSKPLAELFIAGAFNTIDISEAELKDSVKSYLKENACAAALYEYATLSNSEGKQVSEKLEKQIKTEPDSIDYQKFFKEAFYNVSYTDYLFSLPMGAGKTYLMAAFIYLDLYFAINEPHNSAFAHNFIVLAPSGLKSSLIPSLKTIQNFEPSWILPEPSASNIKKMILFEVLDQNKTDDKSNKTKNPNVQKISIHQPLNDLFGLIAITNAEKVILDRMTLAKGKKDQIWLEPNSDNEKDKEANELRNLLGKLPSLSIFIDEVHHAVKKENKLRENKLRTVVNKWAESNNSLNSVIGFSGTPYLEKAEKLTVTNKLKISTIEITNIVYYYSLIKGIGNFLKKPDVRVLENAKSSEIIEKSVKEFLDRYKDKTYANGTTAKLGIYCGTIEKLEEIVYPLVCSILEEYEMPNSCVLKLYRNTNRGNKKYSVPAEAQLEFDTLDKTISKIRIILLAQIGKEGWDCRSLTGIVLSQENKCPNNMVLQTSCRCLRQVDKGVPETAFICLNDDNAKKLEAELKKQQHITLKEFQNAECNKNTLKRYDRTGYLKLPKIEFYQLKIRYETLIAEKTDIAKEIQSAANNAVNSKLIVSEMDLINTEKKVVYIDDSEKGNTYTTYSMWINDIVKSSFGTITADSLKRYESQLRGLFYALTFEKDGIRYFTSKIDIDAVNANVRKAFSDKRDFTATEELIPETASILNIANFTNEVKTDTTENYIPEQSVVESIICADKGESDENLLKIVDSFRKLGENEEADKWLARLAGPTNKDRTYHYLPYHTDSNFERTFYKEISNNCLLSELGLEVYYNGDRALTEFKIRCYKKSGNRWSYIGMYTPDFLIIKRKDGAIHKAIIIETKGGLYAKDETFKDKRAFVESEFIRQNNMQFGYERFEYLYLEDTLPDNNRIEKVYTKMKEFFSVKSP